MKNLNDETLLDAYKKAIELQLNEEFIELLENEIKNRNIDLNIYFRGFQKN